MNSSLPTQVGEVVGDILVCDIISQGRGGGVSAEMKFFYSRSLLWLQELKVVKAKHPVQGALPQPSPTSLCCRYHSPKALCTQGLSLISKAIYIALVTGGGSAVCMCVRETSTSVCLSFACFSSQSYK